MLSPFGARLEGQLNGGSIMVTKYLRQKGSGHIYISTPLIAGRKDMVDYDPDVAKIRIGMLKKKIADKQIELDAMDLDGGEEALKMREQAKELTDLEEAEKHIEKAEEVAVAKAAGEETLAADLPKYTDEEIAAIQRNETIEKDPHIIKIRAFTNKNEVEGYVLEEFGTDIDRALDLNDLKQMAELMRAQRIFEE